MSRSGDMRRGSLPYLAVAVLASVVSACSDSRPSIRAVRTLSAREWEAVSHAGRRLDADTTRVSVVVFSDFQCPYCQRFEAVLRSVQRERGGFGVRFHHFPLTRIHAFALPAAVASECAAAQGRFREFHDAMFRHQGELSERPWPRVAREAGVTDLAAFDRCVLDSREIEGRIRDGLRLVKSLQLTGTPSVIVHGRLLRGTPSAAQLKAALDAGAND